MSNLLFNEIYKIQKEYLKILVVGKNNLDNAFNINLFFDEIKIFWKRNKQIVDLFLLNCCSNKDCYFYTAATILDLDNKEHFPFLTYGQIHIWDDPLCSYIEASKNPSNYYIGIFRSQIMLTLNNDIRILEELNKHILVLPLRLIFEPSIDDYAKNVELLFLNMLNSEIPLKDFVKFNTIDEINSILKPEAQKFIIFNGDNQEEPFQTRFENYINTNNTYFGKKMPKGMILYRYISGLWMQSMHILEISQNYNIIPLLRYELSMNYFLWLWNILSADKLDAIYIKSLISYIQSRQFNYSALDYSLEQYLCITQEFQYSEKVFREIVGRDYTEQKAETIARIIYEIYKEMANKYNFQ